MKCLIKAWRASCQRGLPRQRLAERTHRRELADASITPLGCCYCLPWVVRGLPPAEITILSGPASQPAPQRALFLQPWLSLRSKLLDLSLSHWCFRPEGPRYCRASCGLTGQPCGGEKALLSRATLQKYNTLHPRKWCVQGLGRRLLCLSCLTLLHLLFYLVFLRELELELSYQNIYSTKQVFMCSCFCGRLF